MDVQYHIKKDGYCISKESDQMKQHYAYMNIKNRNAKAKELIAQGYKIRKSSIRGQEVHPEYVDDYEQSVRHLSAEDRGFGNIMYKTYFKVLYLIDVLEYPPSMYYVRSKWGEETRKRF